MTITEKFDINTGDVLVEVHSTTCGVCRKMAPLVNKLVANHTNVRFVDLLTDDEEIGDEVIELATKFNVATLPTFIHLVDGQVVGQVSGFKQLTQLEADLKL
jgi:thioredoxin-like negative regulator of GroEL